MSATLENTSVKYADLISEIETGQVKIPQFQRKFVWSVKASAKLLDSIIKGFPIGTFIYWRTNERLRAIRNLGNITLPEPQQGEFVNYVLDGQQRLTSLYASLKGVSIIDADGNTTDYSHIYVDLLAKNDDDIIITEIEGKNQTDIIKLTDLMNGGLTMLASYPPEHHKTIEKLKLILTSYAYSVINLKNASIEVATEVFTRLNVGGKSLTLFEIMVAKTYHIYENEFDEATQQNKVFDLAVKYEELIKQLKVSHYETIPSATILQVVAMLLTKNCTKKSILQLDKMKFINIWDEAVECIKSSIDFFRSYGIPVSRILPYYALIVPFSYYFYKHKQSPVGKMKEMLEDFFWRASLGFRYSSGVESKLAQDITKIENIIEGKLPKYEWAINVNKEFVETNGWFSTGKSFIKAVLCLYAKQKPKRFNNNLDVIIDNSYLKIASSKNYHHFFPKAWLKKNQPSVDGFKVNHIVNITIVDDFLNKNIIRAKSPSVYMTDFKEKNTELADTMKTHLIDVDNDGIWSNDFLTFYNNRLTAITTKLNNFIIPQDTTGQNLEVYEDVEEVEEETNEINID
ncbi:MAG: DUF262 domain-containing protein [Chitinophagaceae bacterium]